MSCSISQNKIHTNRIHKRYCILWKRGSYMEMTYNEALVMPKNYAIVNEDEMTYVDGCWCIERHRWGHNIYFTHSETLIFSTGLGGIADIVSILSVFGGLATKVISKIVSAVAKGAGKMDNGYGVRLRLTFAIPSGVFSLSRSEAKIASKNKVI